MTRQARSVAACLFLAAVPATAFADTGAGQELHPGIGIDVVASTDADKTDVIKVAARALLDYEGFEKYRGLVFEQAWFRPFGQKTRRAERGYLDIADKFGDWRWNARIGTDGHTVLGSADIHSKDWSREAFVEREIVETPMGIDRGIYYTFAGASTDLPLDERNLFTVMAGVQDFTGKNVRLHLRGNYIHVVKPPWGLSAQLRARYYHSTEPGEFDYYSPRDYLQILPMVQLRQFHKGWEYRLQAAYGAQHATASGWSSSRYADLRVVSPRFVAGWELHAEVTYSNTSPGSGPNYDYVRGSFGLAKAF